MAAVAYRVGYVSVGGPDVGALRCLEELLPVLRLGVFYCIAVPITCLSVRCMNRVVSQCSELLRLVV